LTQKTIYAKNYLKIILNHNHLILTDMGEKIKEEGETLLDWYRFGGWEIVGSFGPRGRYCGLRMNGSFVVIDVLKNCEALKAPKR
jgi:hypothetical protein